MFNADIALAGIEDAIKYMQSECPEKHRTKNNPAENERKKNQKNETETTKAVASRRISGATEKNKQPVPLIKSTSACDDALRLKLRAAGVTQAQITAACD